MSNYFRPSVIAYQVYPYAGISVQDLEHTAQVLVAVKYPAYRGLCKNFTTESVGVNRVFFHRPLHVLHINRREAFYSLIEYRSDLKGCVLAPKGKALAESGHKGFCLVDHLNRPMAYVISSPWQYVFYTCTEQAPTPIAELAEALDDLESLEEVARMYEVSPQSILTRLQVFNSTHPPQPLYPPHGYMQTLLEAIRQRRIPPHKAAQDLGVSLQALQLWFHTH